MKTILGPFVCIVLSAPASLRAAEDASTVSVHGQTVIVGGNVVRARASAYVDLQHKALEQVVTSLGGPAEGVDPEVDRAVYAHAAELVGKVDVAGENVDLNILGLDGKGHVKLAAVRAALGGHVSTAPRASARRTGGKRVLVLATEQLGPRRFIGWTDWAFGPSGGSSRTKMMAVSDDMGGIEAAFSDVLGGGGFDVIDPHVLHGRLAPRPIMSVVDITADDARAIASKADADYVLVAKGMAKDAYHATIAEAGMVSGQGNVVARLVRVSDGKVIAASTQHAAAVHIDLDTARLNALDEAARLAGQALLEKANAE